MDNAEQPQEPEPEFEPPEEFEDDLFERNRVFELDDEDFALQAVDGLTLKAKGCSIVLFYGKGPLSRQLVTLWHNIAQEFSGVGFYAVNTTLRRNIMRRFTDIKMSPNHMQHKFTVRQVPFIIVYREVGDEPGISYPQDFYNGQISSDAYETGDLETSMYDWIENLACTVGPPAGEPGDEDENVPRDYGDYERPSQSVIDRVIASREKELDNLNIEDAQLDEGRMPPDEPIQSVRKPLKVDIGYVRF